MQSLLFSALFLALLSFSARAESSLSGEQVVEAEHFPLTDSGEPPAGLADIEGLPQVPAQVLVGEEIKAAPGGDEPGCNKLPANLRGMVFRHLENFQALQNTQGLYFPDKAAVKASQLLGMVPKESSGDPSAVADMKGAAAATYKAETSLERWRSLFSHKKIIYNKQTN